jgi:hypothetical protein
MSEVQLGFLDAQNRIYEQMGIDRRETFAFDSLSDSDYDSKKLRLEEQIKATEGLRQAGDLMVAAFFDAPKPKERADKQQVYLAMLSGAFNDEALKASIEGLREELGSGENGIRPFHWDLEFPEVFSSEGVSGFQVFVGNPPFLGGPQLSNTFGGSEYQEWLKSRASNSFGHADLSAYFFRRAYDLLGDGGSLGLVATKTAAEGDTRKTALQDIARNNGLIYAAQRNLRWPGVASVIVSVIHVAKNPSVALQPKLDSKYVQSINSRLHASPELPDPEPLAQNEGLAFNGVDLGGKGFYIGEEEYQSLIKEDPSCTDVVMPLLGGEEVNTNYERLHDRYAINFKKMSLEQASAYPVPLSIVRERVKPERDKAKDHGPGKHGKKYWWQHTLRRDPLYQAISGLKKCLVCAVTTANLSFLFVDVEYVLANSLVVLPFDKHSIFACLESSLHKIWSDLLATRLGSTMRYSPLECFQTYPLPFMLTKENGSLVFDHDKNAVLEDAGMGFHRLRSSAMTSEKIGLTTIANSLNDPDCMTSWVVELRQSKSALDNAVLDAYGWSDLQAASGYGLDLPLDADYEAGIPEDLQERIDGGDLFFPDASDALDFQGQLHAYGAISGRRRLSWRYRWPDAVRDEVLARLLALNAERYLEEVNKGLHGGGRGHGGVGGSGVSSTGRRRGRPPKNPPTDSSQSSQFDLGL